LSRYVHNASQKDSYICREIAREEKKEREKECGRGWKSGSARKGGTIDGKSEILQARRRNARSDFYTYIRAYAHRIGRTDIG